MRFHTFERFNENERFELRRVGARITVAALAGAAVLAALVLALPSG